MPTRLRPVGAGIVPLRLGALLSGAKKVAMCGCWFLVHGAWLGAETMNVYSPQPPEASLAYFFVRARPPPKPDPRVTPSIYMDCYARYSVSCFTCAGISHLWDLHLAFSRHVSRA